MTRPPVGDSRLLHEAADWATALHFGTPTVADRQRFERWRDQSAAHDAAWARAQAVLKTFEPAGTVPGRAALQALSGQRRRRLRHLGAALLLGPATVLVARQLPWQAWTADARTATGERRTLALPDGSTLMLNTASAVALRFSDRERRVVLATGEILVTTGDNPADPSRPFLVETPVGLVRPLGTRFSVRMLSPTRCRVAVFASEVEIAPAAGAVRRLGAGSQCDVEAAGVQPTTPADPAAVAWENGMLQARDMRLADVVAEMSRYRPGILRCAAAVANLRVSGAISIADTDVGLSLLARSLPVRVVSRTRYWVTVEGVTV